MKREYTKPESKFVDTTLNGTVLDPGIEDGTNPDSVPLSNKGGWDDDYEKLPTAKSVWGNEETEE